MWYRHPVSTRVLGFDSPQFHMAARLAGASTRAYKLGFDSPGPPEMKTTEIPPSSCPRCGERMELATSVTRDDSSPRPGAFTICWRCGQLMRFDEGLHAVMAFEHELEELDPHLRAVLARLRALLPKFWETQRR